jgi:3-oxo-5-alpha-steroid 4-dehydrogenase 1
MNENPLSFFTILGGLAVSLGVFVTLLFISAPYGRHARQGWGPQISNLSAWIIMESPAALAFGVCFASGTVPKNILLWLFFVLWELHYVHRAIIYPLSIRSGRKKMPVAVALLGFIFNLGNACANGHYLFSLSGGYPQSWLSDPRFLAGVGLFLTGFIINRQADRILRSLRKPGEICYRIPYGGFFRWVSCPNYLGEIIEWFGWALATWSLPGLFFAVWTFANLAPRARSHHTWYHANFAGYPVERKALIPWIW